MPLPPAATLVTVHGQILAADGTPATGRLSFRMPYPLRDTAGDVIIGPRVTSATLDEDGEFTVELIATDDPDLTPTSWTYTVQVSTDVWRTSFNIEVPYDTVGTLEFADIAPAITPPAVATYILASTRGQAGGIATLDEDGKVPDSQLPTSSGTGTVTSVNDIEPDETGNITLTASDVGAAAVSHTHAASAITSGTLDIARIPTGTSGTTVALGNDGRLSDARTPTTHAASHGDGGTDEITIAQSQVTGLADDLAAKLPLAGGTLTGPLTVNANDGEVPPPYGPTSALNTGINIVSSYQGGDDDGTGTDSTGRLNLYSFQRGNSKSLGETIRHFLMRKDAKAMEAWYFPDGGYDENREPVGNWKPVVWAGAHWEANNHASNHKHWSVETPDPTGAIQTRFEVRWGDPTVDDAIAGLDKTIVATNLADLVVRCSNGQELRLSAPAGTQKSLMFSNDSEGGSSHRRWLLRATSTAESGANAGSDLQIVRYADDGTLIDQPIIITRSSGLVTIGGTSGTAGGVAVNRASGTAVLVTHTGSSGILLSLVTADTASRLLEAGVSGDTNKRFVIFGDGQVEWGPGGSSGRDTNLYRNAADQLKTDDSLIVATRLTAGQGTAGTDIITGHSAAGTNSAGFFRAAADGTASLGVVRVETPTTGKRALDIRVTNDTVSRIRIDTSAGSGAGTIVFGNGTTADTNLYRSAADTLKTDDALVVTGTLTAGAISSTDAATTRTNLGVAAASHTHTVRQTIDFGDDRPVLTTGTGTARWYNRTGVTLTIARVWVAAGVAPTGADLVVDVHKNGTTIYSTQANRPTVAAGGNGGTATVPDVTSLADGDYLTFDIDQIGSTIAGGELTGGVVVTYAG